MTERDIIEARLRKAELFLGSRIRERRKQLGLSQSELGALIGLPYQQVQRYEAGSNAMAAARLPDLSQALRVPVMYFFEADIPAIDTELDDAIVRLGALPDTPLRAVVFELINQLAS